MPTRRKYHPTDFSERLWLRLLGFALDKADTFECAVPYRVVVQDIDAAPLWPDELNGHRRSLLDRHVSLIRWELVHDYPTQFLRFRLTAALRSYIRGLRRLDEWSWPLGRPEDPSFLLGDSPVLVTESVSGRIAVFADSDEVLALDGVGVRLMEPLGVKAEPWPTP